MSKEVASQNKAPENLLVTLKEAQTRLDYLPRELMAELADSLDVPVTLIGQVVQGEGVQVIGGNGLPVDISTKGYDHFSHD